MLTCPTPPAPIRGKRSQKLRRVHRRSPSSKISAQIVFVMDAVKSVRDLATNFINLKSELEYYPDPVVQNFTETERKKMFKGEALIIEVNLWYENACQDFTKKNILIIVPWFIN